MRVFRSHAMLAIALMIGVLVGSCRRDDRDRDDVPPATMPAPGGMTVIRVTDVDVGNAIGPDKRILGDDDEDEFRPTDTIYASVATDGAAPSAALSARWIYEDGQLVEETSQTISPSTAGVTEFHVSKPSGWPKGKYKVDILLNGAVVDSEDFEIKAR